jgi:hypothetical protein
LAPKARNHRLIVSRQRETMSLPAFGQTPKLLQAIGLQKTGDEWRFLIVSLEVLSVNDERQLTDLQITYVISTGSFSESACRPVGSRPIAANRRRPLIAPPFSAPPA